MELREYIKLIGVRDFARKFGITERAAIAYRQRARRPRPAVAQRIVDDSPVTWEGIYALKNGKKRNGTPK
jgi:hypothetical protein